MTKVCKRTALLLAAALAVSAAVGSCTMPEQHNELQDVRAEEVN